MPRRKVQSAFALGLMVGAFALVAVHAYILHEGITAGEACPLCNWGHTLALAEVVGAVVVVISLTGRVPPEPAFGFSCGVDSRPFSARAPPRVGKG